MGQPNQPAQALKEIEGVWASCQVPRNNVGSLAKMTVIWPR